MPDPFSLTPTGDVASTNISSSGENAFGEIDEGVDTPEDTTFIENNTGADASLELNLADMPTNFGSLDTINLRIRGIYLGDSIMTLDDGSLFGLDDGSVHVID